MGGTTHHPSPHPDPAPVAPTCKGDTEPSLLDLEHDLTQAFCQTPPATLPRDTYNHPSPLAVPQRQRPVSLVPFGDHYSDIIDDDEEDNRPLVSPTDTIVGGSHSAGRATSPMHAPSARSDSPVSLSGTSFNDDSSSDQEAGGEADENRPLYTLLPKHHPILSSQSIASAATVSSSTSPAPAYTVTAAHPRGAARPTTWHVPAGAALLPHATNGNVDNYHRHQDAATASTTARHRTHRYSLGTYPDVAPPRYRRQATTDSTMSNDSDTSLPDYVCTIQREGPLEMKMEFDDNDTRSKHRVWRTRYVQLWGTCLRIYAKKPRSPEDTLPLHNINMQKVQAGLALDYHKKRHVFRVHADGLQFLLQGVSSMEMIYWIDALQASANIALPIEERVSF